MNFGAMRRRPSSRLATGVQGLGGDTEVARKGSPTECLNMVGAVGKTQLQSPANARLA